MRVAVFGTSPHDRTALERANAGAEHGGHVLEFIQERLDPSTATRARGTPAVCAFVNDRLDALTLAALHAGGTQVVALRSAGHDNVDADAAERLGIVVLHVPAYSPHAVAEHAVALLLCLVRRLHVAVPRVRRQDFSLHGLTGFELRGKTAGVVGTGRIGSVTARILRGFGCRVVACDPVRTRECLEAGVRYVPFDEILARSDIVTLHCPLLPGTRHLLDAAALARMRPGALIVNTSRGAVLDTEAAIAALRTGRLGGLAIDVYEHEAPLFFRDRSDEVLADDTWARLMAFPNVVATAHQAFLTHEALEAIAAETLRNLHDFAAGTTREAVRVRPAGTGTPVAARR